MWGCVDHDWERAQRVRGGASERRGRPVLGSVIIHTGSAAFPCFVVYNINIIIWQVGRSVQNYIDAHPIVLIVCRG